MGGPGTGWRPGRQADRDGPRYRIGGRGDVGWLARLTWRFDGRPLWVQVSSGRLVRRGCARHATGDRAARHPPRLAAHGVALKRHQTHPRWAFHRLSTLALEPVYVVHRLNGRATGKQLDQNGDSVVEIETWAINQRGQYVTPGTATVTLPRRP